MSEPSSPMKLKEAAPPRPYQTSYRVKDVPSRQRPREMFDRLGASGVSDETLLAIILRSGATGANVMDLARDMLHHFGSLTGLATASPKELAKFKGMGPVKIQVLLSALELAKRLTLEKTDGRTLIDSPLDVAEMLREEARVNETEVVWLFMLDNRNRILRPPHTVSSGISNASLVHPREVFKEAIRESATAVILAHNHPSGDPSPSPEDLRITRQIIDAGRLLDIQVLDHVIVGRESVGPETRAADWWLSLRESGLVDFEV